MSRAPGSPLRPFRAPFVYRALCLRQTDRVCFSSSRSPPPSPFFPGSWNALLTLPFPEGLRPCSLRGNRVWHTWAGAITHWDTRAPPHLGTGMLGEWGVPSRKLRARWMGDQSTFLITQFTSPPPNKFKNLRAGSHFGAENQCVMRPAQLRADGGFFPSIQNRTVCVCGGGGFSTDQIQVLKQRCNPDPWVGIPKDP